jgi:hypothetical protein
MATLTGDTKYGEMKVGDVLPTGEEITALIPREYEGRSTVVLTTHASGAYHHYGAMWADETWDESVERARFMHSLRDHS